MDAAIVVALIAAVGSIAAAILSFRASNRANSTNDRKVDLEEHRDAMNRLKEIINEQDKHIDRVKAQMDNVLVQLAREQDVSSTLRQQLRTLQDQVDELTRSRTRLESMIISERPKPPSKER